jgi:hypothetical protein
MELCDISSREPVQEQGSGWFLRQLPFGDAVHAQSNETARSGPRLLIQIGPDAPGEQEPLRPWIIVNGALDRAEYLRNRLPLVEQHRLWLDAQSDIGVRSESCGFSRTVKANDGRGMMAPSRGLARSARPRNEERRELGEQLRQSLVNQPGNIHTEACG